jgi:hypothetical protein
MMPHTLTDDQTAVLINFFDKADKAKTAFGAPGDYGYSTKEGKALYALALALCAAHPIIMDLKNSKTAI